MFDVVVSKDFMRWSEPVPAFYPDLRDDAGSLARLEKVVRREALQLRFPSVIGPEDGSRWFCP